MNEVDDLVTADPPLKDTIQTSDCFSKLFMICLEVNIFNATYLKKNVFNLPAFNSKLIREATKRL